MSKRELIIAQALEILHAVSQGTRYAEFVRSIHEVVPQIPVNTVRGTLWNLDVELPDQVSKPLRGRKVR
jgi:hypothetical protein